MLTCPVHLMWSRCKTRTSLAVAGCTLQVFLSGLIVPQMLMESIQSSSCDLMLFVLCLCSSWHLLLLSNLLYDNSHIPSCVVGLLRGVAKIGGIPYLTLLVIHSGLSQNWTRVIQVRVNRHHCSVTCCCLWAWAVCICFVDVYLGNWRWWSNSLPIDTTELWWLSGEQGEITGLLVQY